MNESALKELDRITSLDAEGLTSSEKAFLKARRDYLSEELKEKFASVLKEKKGKPSAEESKKSFDSEEDDESSDSEEKPKSK